MMLFWIAAAVLLLMAAVLAWFPIFMSRRQATRAASAADTELQAYRSRVSELERERDDGLLEEASYQQLRSELDRGLLSAQEADIPKVDEQSRVTPMANRALAVILTLLLVPGGLALYFYLGSSQVLVDMAYQQALVKRLEGLTAAQRLPLLEEELKQRPDHPDLNYLVAREAMNLKDYARATVAYDSLVHLSKGHPDLLAEYAQASFYMEGNRVGIRSRELARLALSKQPTNSTALGLLGIDAFEQKRYAEAINYWQSILQAHPNIGEAESLRIGIARARAMAGETAAPASEDAIAARLHLEVSLAPELLASVDPDDALFVFARAVAGPPMPLAAVRLRAGDLPREVLLSDAQAMTPAAKLSMAEEVNLVARISKSGTPQGQKGDLEGKLGPIKVKTTQSKIKLVIDKVVE